MEQIVRGHWWMVACSGLYLVWWCVFFAPDAAGQKPSPTGALRVAGVACILGAVACGLLAVTSMVQGMADMTGEAVPGLWINAGCVALYVVLLAVTVRLFDRPVTTELLLFCAWCALELNVASKVAAGSTAGAGAAGGGAAVLLVVLTLATLAACTVCYTLYYRLDYVASFWDGCVPLALVGVVSAVVALVLG